MNRSQTTSKKLNYKVLGFWGIIGLLTLIFVGFITIKFIQTKSQPTMNDMHNLSGQQIFNQDGTYYVFVYSKVGITEDKAELEKLEELEDAILNYLKFSKNNKTAPKLFGMIVDSGAGTYGNYSVLIEGSSSTTVINKFSFDSLRINKKDVPMLMRIRGGVVDGYYILENDIRAEFQSTILQVQEDNKK